MAAWLTGFIALAVLVAGCRREGPSMRFYPKATEKMVLSEVWEVAGTSLQYDSLSASSCIEAVEFGVRPDYEWTEADFKMFTVIVRGQVPCYHFIDVRADYYDSGRVKRAARVEPEQIYWRGGSSTTPSAWDAVQEEGDLHAFSLTALSPHGSARTLILPKVFPGRYYVYLFWNGKRLCGSELTINE